MKKKLFVLFEDGLHPARLEYFDNEKKYKANQPKRSIILKNCLSINQKSDAKHKFAIALYTKDDCFCVVCDNEGEQQEWLGAMEELQSQYHETSADGDSPKPNFEHIWPVMVKSKGLGGNFLSSGHYRLCLTNKSLSFIKLNNTEPEVVYQLPSVRRCGHTDHFFYMEVGTSSRTGAGEIWMQVEDPVIAQNMHEAILSSMKASKAVSDRPHIRPRSQSNADKASKPSNRHTVAEVSPGHSSASVQRSNTMSGWTHPKSPLWRHNKSSHHSTSSLQRSSTMSYKDSSHYPSPLSVPAAAAHSHDGPRGRTDSIGSHSSRRTDSSLSDDLDGAHGDTGSVRSTTPEVSLATSAPGSMMDAMHNDYLDMHAGHLRTVQVEADDEEESESYLNMNFGSNSHNTTDGYIEMGPISGKTPASEDDYLDMSGPSSAASSVRGDPADLAAEYLEVTPARGLTTVQEKTDNAYLEMDPSAKSKAGRGVRMDKVHSFLLDDDSDDFPPKRAYSVGSRPAATAKKLNQTYGYMDMTLGSQNSQSSNASKFKQNQSKSISAPHLPHGVAAKHGLPPPRTRDSSVSSSVVDMDDRFMELDFNNIKSEGDFRARAGSGGSRDIRPRTSSGGYKDLLRPRTSSGGTKDLMRPRTSSGGNKDFRPRASSGEMKDMMRPRTSSFGKEYRKPQTESFGSSKTLGRAESTCHRPRTATICQESFRNRASSFGTTDMRPRSSSHGNARFRELRANESIISSMRSSPDSSKRSIKTVSSKDSVNSATSEYLDMNPRNSPSFRDRHKEHKRVEIVEPYMEMNPSENRAKDEYMDMQPTSYSHNYSTTHSHFKKSIVKSSHKSHGSSIPTRNSSDESLSSSSQSSDGKSLSRIPSNMDEYMDLEYTRNSPSHLSLPTSVLSSSPASGRSVKSPQEDSSYVSYSPQAGNSRESSPNMPRSVLDKVISPIRDSATSAPFAPSSALLHAQKGKGKMPGKHEYVNVQYKQTETVYEQMEYTQQSDSPPPAPVVDSPPLARQQQQQRPSLPDFRTTAPALPERPIARKAQEHDYMEIEPKVSNSGKTTSKSQSSRVTDTDDYMDLNIGGQSSKNIKVSQKISSSCSSFVKKKDDDEDDDYMDITINQGTSKDPKNDADYFEIKPGNAVSSVSCTKQDLQTQSSEKVVESSDYMDYAPAKSAIASSPQNAPFELLCVLPMTGKNVGKSSQEFENEKRKHSGSSKDLHREDGLKLAAVKSLSNPILNKADDQKVTSQSCSVNIHKDDENVSKVGENEGQSTYQVLNYATLDLGNGAEESSKTCGSPESDLGTSGLSYAQIDFKKSQDLPQEPSPKQDTFSLKPPFDPI